MGLISPFPTNIVALREVFLDILTNLAYVYSVDTVLLIGNIIS